MDFAIFRKRFDELIRSRGFTPFGFSVELGMTPSTVQRHLVGTRVPDLESVIRYAKFFGVSTDWLLGLSDERYETDDPRIKKLAKLYTLAQEKDRAVIDLILSRYEAND